MSAFFPFKHLPQSFFLFFLFFLFYSHSYSLVSFLFFSFFTPSDILFLLSFLSSSFLSSLFPFYIRLSSPVFLLTLLFDPSLLLCYNLCFIWHPHLSLLLYSLPKSFRHNTIFCSFFFHFVSLSITLVRKTQSTKITN